MYQALQRTAEYDQLTGLANYSKVARSLDEAILKATSVAPAVAMVFNVVNFAAFNSTYEGYTGRGSSVLRRVADTLRIVRRQLWTSRSQNVSVAIRSFSS